MTGCSMEQLRTGVAVPADFQQAPAWERLVMGLASLGSGSATQAGQVQTQTQVAVSERGLGVAMWAIGALFLWERLRAGWAAQVQVPASEQMVELVSLGSGSAALARQA